MTRMWLYHASEEARIFESEAIEAALARGWADSPAAARAAKAPPPDPGKIVDDVLTREELLSMADSLGVEVDRRWGVIRLREALEEATKGK